MKITEARVFLKSNNLELPYIYKHSDGRWRVELNTITPTDFNPILETGKGEIRRFVDLEAAANACALIGCKTATLSLAELPEDYGRKARVRKKKK